MKQALFALALFASGSLFVLAGEAGDKKAVVPTPPPPEICSWTGFYVGINVGGAFDTADVRLDLRGEWEAFPEPSDETFGERLGSRDLDAAGLLAGGFLGYNFQWNNWVVGGEANIDFVGLRDSSNSGLQFVNPGTGDPITVRESFKSHYRITLGPRIGYAWNRMLLFATGGLAIGDLDASQEIREPEFGFIQRGSKDDTEVGWMVGGGLQYCLTQHWSARIDYRYTDLDCLDFSSVGNDPAFTGRHEVCLSYHSVTAGLSYKF